MSGTLYIVATPIGNLGDLSARAIEILKSVDQILAEDTRRSHILLSHFGIKKPLHSYFEHSSPKKTETILNLLKEGMNMALVSDGGTPALSDPGARLVGLCHSEGILVVPIPGPSALIAALSVCGLKTEPLHFWGFLSPKPSKRKKIYSQILELEGCHAFYESPYKLLKHLAEWKECFADYEFFILKEITKQFEKYWIGKLDSILSEIKESEVKGEFTVLFSKESFVKNEPEP